MNLPTSRLFRYLKINIANIAGLAALTQKMIFQRFSTLVAALIVAILSFGGNNGDDDDNKYYKIKSNDKTER